MRAVVWLLIATASEFTPRLTGAARQSALPRAAVSRCRAGMASGGGWLARLSLSVTLPLSADSCRHQVGALRRGGGRPPARVVCGASSTAGWTTGPAGWTTGPASWTNVPAGQGRVAAGRPDGAAGDVLCCSEHRRLASRPVCSRRRCFVTCFTPWCWNARLIERRVC